MVYYNLRILCFFECSQTTRFEKMFLLPAWTPSGTTLPTNKRNLQIFMIDTNDVSERITIRLVITRVRLLF